MTDWETLCAMCAAHGCYLSLRIETFGKGAEYRFSLAAINRADGGLVFDLRDTATDGAPQPIVTALVTQAIADWWMV